jgi:N-acetylglutamate synthase-like GNAT family acetyltransferase
MGPTHFLLRLAEVGDAAAVKAVVRAAYSKWVPVIGREPMPMRADYERNILEHRVDLVVANDQIVAVLETMNRSDHLWIENVAVTPALHRNGLGGRLLVHAEVLATSAGLNEVRLLTNGAFDTNVALYRRAGYIVERTEPFMGGTTVYMSKRLLPDGRNR